MGPFDSKFVFEGYFKELLDAPVESHQLDFDAVADALVSLRELGLSSDLRVDEFAHVTGVSEAEAAAVAKAVLVREEKLRVDVGDEVSEDEGYCYLAVVADEWQEHVRTLLGSYPTFHELMSLPVSYLDFPAMTKLHLCVVDESLVHIRSLDDVRVGRSMFQEFLEMYSFAQIGKERPYGLHVYVGGIIRRFSDVARSVFPSGGVKEIEDEVCCVSGQELKECYSATLPHWYLANDVSCPCDLCSAQFLVEPCWARGLDTDTFVLAMGFDEYLEARFEFPAFERGVVGLVQEERDKYHTVIVYIDDPCFQVTEGSYITRLASFLARERVVCVSRAGTRLKKVLKQGRFPGPKPLKGLSMAAVTLQTGRRPSTVDYGYGRVFVGTVLFPEKGWEMGTDAVMLVECQEDVALAKFNFPGWNVQVLGATGLKYRQVLVYDPVGRCNTASHVVRVVNSFERDLLYLGPVSKSTLVGSHLSKFMVEYLVCAAPYSSFRAGSCLMPKAEKGYLGVRNRTFSVSADTDSDDSSCYNVPVVKCGFHGRDVKGCEQDCQEAAAWFGSA